MNEIIKSYINKISSYDLLNNLFPGTIFCYIIKNTTRISLPEGDIWEELLIYYFVGMIISRIGSLFIERTLRVIKVKNKKTEEIECFLDFAPYEDYIEASKDNPFLQILNEKNNTYRTIAAMLIIVLVVKLFDWILYDWVNNLMVAGNHIIFVLTLCFIIMLFINSYRKQTKYIKIRVEKYIEEKHAENR